MNNKYFKKIITLYLFIITMSFHFAHSLEIKNNFDGGQEGNGGDAVVCRDANGTITYAEPLDVYEAKEIRNIFLKLPPQLSIESAYTVLIDRLKIFSPIRAERYRSFLSKFLGKYHKTDSSLVDIPDSEHLVFRTGCQVEQLVIQQEPPTPFDHPFIVQKQIWEFLSGAQQAVMVMHEALLEEAIENYKILRWNPIQTRGLRYLNSLIFGFEPHQFYTDITEKMLVEAFMMIPNFYKVETKKFGEIVSKIELGGRHFPIAFQTFDTHGVATEIALFPNPKSGILNYNLSGILFLREKGN